MTHNTIQEHDSNNAEETAENLQLAENALIEAAARIETAEEVVVTQASERQISAAREKYNTAEWRLSMAEWILEDGESYQAHNEAEEAIHKAMAASEDAMDALKEEIASFEYTTHDEVNEAISVAEQTIARADERMKEAREVVQRDSPEASVLNQAEVELNYAESYFDAIAAKVWDDEKDAAVQSAGKCIAHAKVAKLMAKHAEEHSSRNDSAPKEPQMEAAIAQ